MANAEDAKENWLMIALEDQISIQEPEPVSFDRVMVS